MLRMMLYQKQNISKPEVLFLHSLGLVVNIECLLYHMLVLYFTIKCFVLLILHTSSPLQVVCRFGITCNWTHLVKV